MTSSWYPLVGTEYSLSVGSEKHARGVVKQHADALVRQLEAEAVLVGVVDPLRHPQRLRVLHRRRLAVCETHQSVPSSTRHVTASGDVHARTVQSVTVLKHVMLLVARALISTVLLYISSDVTIVLRS